MPPLVKCVSDRIQVSTGESINPKPLLLRPLILATPMVNSGPGVSASPTLQSDRNKVHTHNLTTDGEAPERGRRRTPWAGKVGRNAKAHKPQRPRQRSHNQVHGHPQKGPTLQHGQGTTMPEPNPRAQASTMRRKGPPPKVTQQSTSRTKRPSRNKQGPPPLKRSGAWQHRHSVLNFFDNKASICCI